jgi:hypothetical protein
MINKDRWLQIKWEHLKYYSNEFTFRDNIPYSEFVIYNISSFYYIFGED